MPISSLIIRTKIDRTQRVIDELKKISLLTVEQVHHENIVAVTDTQCEQEDKIIWERVRNISGVIQSDLIFYNFEDVEERKYD